jgi:hypothetical protein
MRPPCWGSPFGGPSAPQVQLLQPFVFLLLVADVLPNRRFAPTHRRDKLSAGPEAQATRDQRLDTAFSHRGERLRSLQIDHQFEPRRLLDVAGLRAIEYFVSEKPACVPHGCDDPGIAGEHAPRAPIAGGHGIRVLFTSFRTRPERHLCAAICDVNRQRQYSLGLGYLLHGALSTSPICC